jgi:hypothetical protein
MTMSARLWRERLGGILVGLMLASSAGAQKTPAETVAAPAETGCKQPLDACTRDRIAGLKAQSKALTAAYRMKPPASLTAEEKDQLRNYDRWLRTQSDRTRELAERGTASTTTATQMAFHEQYQVLQKQMQNENRRYAAISNIMKTKHDTAKNAISNVR